MANINELTAKLKAAAQAALPANERLSVLPPDDIFDMSLVEGEQLDRDITVMNSFNEIANPASVLTLIDALEAAEQNSDGVAGLVESYETTISMLKNRIDELEARTLTVKLPTEYIQLFAVKTCLKSDVIKSLNAACAAAGIKLQIEGE